MKMFKGQIECENDYRLVVVEDCFEVYDNKDDKVYYEDNDGFWSKREYDNQGNEIYYENSRGYWSKSEYDKDGNRIYYETCRGKIIDKRTVELTHEQIADKFGVKVENLKIKKGDK